MCFRENIYTCIIHHISKNISNCQQFTHQEKIAFTKMYRTQKLINQFLNQVEYPIKQSVCVLCVKIIRDMIAKMQDG